MEFSVGNKITITGITEKLEKYDAAGIIIANQQYELIAGGICNALNASMTFDIKVGDDDEDDDSSWNETGSFYLKLLFFNKNTNIKNNEYIYIGKETINNIENNITDDTDNTVEQAAKITITRANTTITFNMFANRPPPTAQETTFAQAPATQTSSQHNWMSKVPDSKLVRNIAIPGTHDAAAYNTYKIFEDYAKCQSTTIAQQLNDGIRYFDIRVGKLKKRHSGNLYHGIIRLWTRNGRDHLYLRGVVDDCIHFLNNNPTETVILSLQHETSAKGNFKNECASSFTAGKEKYWLFEDFINKRLGEVRGKILLINSSDTGKSGFTQNTNNTHKQNDWTAGGPTYSSIVKVKNEKIWKFLFESRESKYNNMLLLNQWNRQANFFCSVSDGAFGINNAVWRDLTTFQFPRGIQVMDYYWKEHVDRIINTPVNKETF
jgi:hypothetical protein